MKKRQTRGGLSMLKACGFHYLIVFLIFLIGNFPAVHASEKKGQLIEEIEEEGSYRQIAAPAANLRLAAPPANLRNQEEIISEDWEMVHEHLSLVGLAGETLLKILSYSDPFDLIRLESVCKYFYQTLRGGNSYTLWKRFLSPAVVESIENTTNRHQMARNYFFMRLAEMRGSKSRAERRQDEILVEKLNGQRSALSLLFGVGRIPDEAIIPQKWKEIDSIYELDDEERREVQKEWLKRAREEKEEKIEKGEDVYDPFNPPNKDKVQATVFWVRFLGYVPNGAH